MLAPWNNHLKDPYYGYAVTTIPSGFQVGTSGYDKALKFSHMGYVV